MLRLLALFLCSISTAAQAAPTLKPSQPAPGFAAVQRAARAVGLEDARAHSPGLPLGGARFLSVVSSLAGRRVELLVVEPQGSAWRVAHRLALPPKPPIPHRSRPAPELCADPAQQKIAAVAFVDDYDRDGRPEAMVRHLFCWTVPAIGAVQVRRLFVVNLEGTPRIALELELGYDALPTTMGKRTGRAEFEDLDGDGHPDLRVKDQLESPELPVKRSERRFLYDAATDAYREAPRKLPGR